MSRMRNKLIGLMLAVLSTGAMTLAGRVMGFGAMYGQTRITRPSSSDLRAPRLPCSTGMAQRQTIRRMITSSSAAVVRNKDSGLGIKFAIVPLEHTLAITLVSELPLWRRTDTIPLLESYSPTSPIATPTPTCGSLDTRLAELSHPYWV